MKKIEHLGIAVKNLEESEKLFESLLNTHVYKREYVEEQKVTTSFLRAGNNKIELLKASSSDSVINKFIEKRGEGLHHVAFSVSDIRYEMARLTKEGFTLLSEEPQNGADNKLVCFLHPKEANVLLVELVQDAD